MSVIRVQIILMTMHDTK